MRLGVLGAPRRMAGGVPRLAELDASRGEVAHVLFIATEHRQESVILLKCAELLGYRSQVVGFKQKWEGWVTKLRRYETSLRESQESGQIAPRDPVMLIDGWDCALVGPAEEFKQKLAGEPYASRRVWYAGERLIGPDFFLAPRIDEIYPNPQTPWRYPNAGCMAGRAEDCLRFLQDLLVDFPEGGNDQEQLHLHLLRLAEAEKELPAWVDSRCGLFQCLYEAEPQWTVEGVNSPTPRIRNVETGQRPVVLHGNGHTGRWFMCELWHKMRFLERCGLCAKDLAYLPFDGPVAPGTVPDAEVTQEWSATFELYRIIEMQLTYARIGVKYDPWEGIFDKPPDPRGEPEP